MVPLYVRYMGAEAYGLVGFFAMLQAIFQLLDMGLTPTMARETARFNGGAIDALALRRLLRALEGVFIGIAVFGAGAIIICSGGIATSWLKVQELPLVEVRRAVTLIAVIIALRWVCGLYRGVINGFEQMVWLSGFNSAIATARFVLVIPVFVYVGTTPGVFFSYQLIIAVIEVFVLAARTYHHLPKVAAGQRTPWQWEPVHNVLKFSLSMAFTSSVWVLVTQSDKLVLSKLLSLTDYAYFTLAVLVASGIYQLYTPITGVMLPRLTRLSAEKDEDGLIRIYRSGTQLVAMLTSPASFMLVFFAEHILWVWTGNAEISQKAAPVLSLYALGNGILAIGAFPSYLQFAKGDLKLHVVGNGLFLVFFLPSLVCATIVFGTIGAGYSWVAVNTLYFIFWIPRVHRRFAVGLHSKWILQDIIPSYASSLAVTIAAKYLVRWPDGRAFGLMTICAIGSAALLASLASSSNSRAYLKGKFFKKNEAII